MGKIEQMVDPSDYRDVGGVKVAHQMKLTNAMQSISMKFTKIENNVTIDEKMFSKP